MNNHKDLVDKLVEIRKKRNITQVELAEKLNMKQPNLARIEKGGRVPSLQMLCGIANAVGAKIKIE